MSKTIDIQLIVDDREHTVYNELIKSHPNELWYSKQRLRYGDFAIVSSCECLLAIIERKTIADYGASIRDGRHKNKDKIIELRTKAHCNVYYIIEGEFYNTPDCNTFNGIPMSAIRSSVYNLAVRDDIVPLIVDNHHKTIANLCGLVKSYQKHHKCTTKNTNTDIIDVNTVANVKDIADNSTPIIITPLSTSLHTNDVTNAGGNDNAELDEHNYQKLLDELPLNTIRANVLTSIPYITKRILPIIDKYSIKELCIDHILDKESIMSPKMSARFHINDTALFEKMLLCIPNMVKATASKLANTITFGDLVNDNKKINIGPQTNNIIMRIIHHKPTNN